MSEPSDVEQVDAVSVLVSAPAPVTAARALGRSVTPTAQAAAVMAGSFAAGAAVVGLVHRHRGRAAGVLAKAARPRRGLRRAAGTRRERKAAGRGELVRIVGTRSLLVDVHLLGAGGGDR